MGPAGFSDGSEAQNSCLVMTNAQILLPPVSLLGLPQLDAPFPSPTVFFLLLLEHLILCLLYSYCCTVGSFLTSLGAAIRKELDLTYFDQLSA